jgi:hypothetical protein
MKRVFISYSHKDEEWKDRLVAQLGVLQQQGLLEIWEDRQIAAGDDWLPAIESALNTCNTAVLLISANFLTSKFILEEELPQLLKRRQDEGVRVIPLIAKPCAWQSVKWLKKIQARPKGNKALSEMRKPIADAALAAFAKEVDLNQAVAGMRESGYQYYLPLGLFARAAYYRSQNEFALARAGLSFGGVPGEHRRE